MLVSPYYARLVSERDGRRLLPIRISWSGHAALQKRADEETAGNVSELVRRMLKFALREMPKGWR